MADTRRRILEAALAEFTEAGIEHTSMLAVSRRADVASGTVLYHFTDVDHLASALVSDLWEKIRLPGADAIDRHAPVGERVSTLIRLMYGFYESTGELYGFFVRNQDHAAVRHGLAEFQEALAELQKRALAGTRTKSARAVVASLVDVSFYASLTRNGLTRSEAIRVATELAVDGLGS